MLYNMSEAIDRQTHWNNTPPLPQDGDADGYSPEGMQVLAIDTNAFCLKFLVSLLQRCKYEVTATAEAAEAFKILTENQNKFEIVIANTGIGFLLLEKLGHQLDIPVIIVSADDRRSSVLKSMKYKAVKNYMDKPVRIQEIKILWKHGRKMYELRRLYKQLKPKTNKSDKEEATTNTYGSTASDDDAFQKKQRVVWTFERHKKFEAAVQKLGPAKATPKEIHRLMNEEGISRQSVSSHLQKYRMQLSKQERANQQRNNGIDLTHDTHKRKLEGEENMVLWNPGTNAKIQRGQALTMLESTFKSWGLSSAVSAFQQTFVSHCGGGGSNYKGLDIEQIRDRLQNQAAAGLVVSDNATKFMQQSVEPLENIAPLQTTHGLWEDSVDIQDLLKQFLDNYEAPCL